MSRRPAAAARPPRRPAVRLTPTVQSLVEEHGHAVERLQKILANAGFGSRRQCEEFITAGRVSIDGEIVTQLGVCIDPSKHDLRFDGQRVKSEAKVYWWLNKPRGVICTNSDTHGRRTVLELIPGAKHRMYCVGRLDEDSTGLILMTNDGELAHRLTHPSFGVTKTYHVLAAGLMSTMTVQKLLTGVWLSEGRFQASFVKRIGVVGKATRLEVVLREGHNRQIRRMLAKLGHKVMRLERVGIGPIKVRKLPIGHARPATGEEVAMLAEVANQAVAMPPKPAPTERREPKTSAPRSPRPARRAPKAEPLMPWEQGSDEEE